MLEFHRLMASHWISDWMRNISVASHFYNPSDTVANITNEVQGRVASFLRENRSNEVVREEQRCLLREMVFAQLQRTGGYDPGHNLVDMNLLLQRFGVLVEEESDEEE